MSTILPFNEAVRWTDTRRMAVGRPLGEAATEAATSLAPLPSATSTVKYHRAVAEAFALKLLPAVVTSVTAVFSVLMLVLTAMAEPQTISWGLSSWPISTGPRPFLVPVSWNKDPPSSLLPRNKISEAASRTHLLQPAWWQSQKIMMIARVRVVTTRSMQPVPAHWCQAGAQQRLLAAWQEKTKLRVGVAWDRCWPPKGLTGPPQGRKETRASSHGFDIKMLLLGYNNFNILCIIWLFVLENFILYEKKQNCPEPGIFLHLLPVVCS